MYHTDVILFYFILFSFSSQTLLMVLKCIPLVPLGRHIIFEVVVALLLKISDEGSHPSHFNFILNVLYIYVHFSARPPSTSVVSRICHFLQCKTLNDVSRFTLLLK